MNHPLIHARDEMSSISADPVSYQVTMEATQQHWVFALDIPYEWDLDSVVMGRQQQLARMQPIDQRLPYNVVSYPNFRLNSELSPIELPGVTTSMRICHGNSNLSAHATNFRSNCGKHSPR